MAPPFPSDWDDDERMSFLFSAFKLSRDVDSADWDSKMAFWTPLIIMHAKAQGLLTISLRHLQKGFTRKGISPLGLGTVVQEMLRQGSLQRESDFVAGITSGWVSWGVRELVIKPLRWTISSVLGGQLNPDEPFVVPEVMKEQADVVLQKYRSSPLCTVPLLCEDDVHGLCKDLIPTKSAFQLVLLQLLRDKKVCLLQRDGERLVKFVHGGSNQVTPIGDTDLGIYDLQKSEKLLSERLQSACDESSRLTEEAKSFNKAGNKQKALRCLRRRKVAEKRISALQSKLDTVQSILERISMAETDRKVVSAYQAGVSALRSALKDVSLEKTESLVSQIQEFCDLQDDVNQTLSSVGISDLDVDTDELERELNEILQKEEVDLPDVPAGPLIVSPQHPPLSHRGDNRDVDTDELERELNEILQKEEVDLPDVPAGPLIVSPQHPPLSHRGDNRALDMSGMLSALPDAPSGHLTRSPIRPSVGQSNQNVDTDELERELNEILQKEEVDLPDVPAGPLIVSPQHPPLSHRGDNRDVDTDELERELNEILQKEEVDLPDVPAGPLIVSPQHPPLSHRGDNRALDMSGMLSALPDAPSGHLTRSPIRPSVGQSNQSAALQTHRALFQ